ncbi:MAG: hypothetical protein IID37_13345, partial [Planctomycetes bacterium]|nr:hypothetical protein [Planctomycetota bacterium]
VGERGLSTPTTADHTANPTIVAHYTDWQRSRRLMKYAGGVFADAGLDLDRLREHCQQTGSVVGFDGTRSIDNGELLSLDVDILIPAAMGGAITKASVEQVNARLVVEAANSPVTPEADEILERRGVTVVPDILANAGGVTVSYFEWVQNLQQFHWSLEKVNTELEQRMVAAWQRVHQRHQDDHITLRTAAYVEAIDKVAAATRLRF